MEEAPERPNCTTVWHRWDLPPRAAGFALIGDLAKRWSMVNGLRPSSFTRVEVGGFFAATLGAACWIRQRVGCPHRPGCRAGCCGRARSIKYGCRRPNHPGRVERPRSSLRKAGPGAGSRAGCSGKGGNAGAPAAEVAALFQRAVPHAHADAGGKVGPHRSQTRRRGGQARRRGQGRGRGQADRRGQGGGGGQADRRGEGGGGGQADRRGQGRGRGQADRRGQGGRGGQADRRGQGGGGGQADRRGQGGGGSQADHGGQGGGGDQADRRGQGGGGSQADRRGQGSGGGRADRRD